MTIPILNIELLIPIILVISYLLFPIQFILQSNTILGKLLSIFIIAVYTNVHFLYGLVVCLFIIFYYQSDYVYNIIVCENFQPPSTTDKVKESMVEQRNSVFTSSSYNNDDKIPYNKVEQPLLDVNKAYSGEKLPIQSESETIFRNQQCNSDLEFFYKNQIIKHNETIQNLIPEIQFVDDKPCNPCDPSCPFSIKSSLEKKDFIGQSTRGKTSLEEVMDWADSFFVNKSEPFAGVDLNVASYVK